MKTYFHRENQFLDLTGRMGYKFFTHEVVQAQVTYDDIRLLSK